MNLFDLCVYKNLNKESGGDVDVSSLVATENKTYNAGEGKAYNPVVVNVPTPSPSLQSLTASHNGYFVPSSGYDGFDEVTVDVATPLETLSATENGTYTPSSGYEGFSEVTVDVPLPNNAYLLESQKDDVVTIQHGAEFDMPKLIVSIEPQQDLHGYDSPWVGGSGKNKLQISATSQSLNGVTFTVNSDGTVNTSNTATGTFSYTLFSGSLTFAQDVIISGCPENGSLSSYALTINNGATTEVGSGITIPANTEITAIAIRIANGTNMNGKVFKPMIRLASVTDATFAPYSNECPISGWTACNVVRTGENLIDITSLTPSYAFNGISYTINSDGSVTVDGTATARSQVYWSIPQNVAKTFANKKLNGGTSQSGCSLFLELNASPYTTYATDTGLGSTISADIASATNDVNLVFRIAQGTTLSNLTIRPTIANASNTYTINFVDGSNPLTVYGGTFDLLSGVLTVDRAYVDMSEITAEYNSGWNCWTISTSVLPNAKIIDNNNTPTTAISDRLKAVKASGYTTSHESGTMAQNTSNMWFIDNGSTTELSGQLVYELATPQTYQLTPTEVKSLLGVNNIFADTGEVDVQIWTKEA